MPTPFRTLVEADKLIAGTPVWGDKHKGSKRSEEQTLVASLRIGARALQGLELVGRARLDLRNRYVTFTLIYLPTNNRRDAVQLCRLDWRPLTVHANDHPNTPLELIGDIRGSHHHPFDLNLTKKEGIPIKSLPIAVEISPDYQSYTELLDGVADLFRIANACDLPSPWPQDLFG